MKRKLVQLARSTLVVSLPYKWVSKYGLKKGDEVELEQKEREIIIKTGAGIGLKKLELKLEGPPEMVKRRVNVAYKRGYDEIEASFEDAEVVSWIEEELETLVGFEIIDQGEHYCLIKSVSAGLEEEFDNIIRRVFRMLLQMAKSMEEAISKKEFNRLPEIAKSERMNNKLTNFCKRLVNKKGFHEQTDSNLIYTIIWELEHLADEYRDICNYLANGKISKETLQFFKKVNEILKEFYEMFYNYKDERAIQFSKDVKNLRKELKESLYHKEKDDTIVRFHIYSLIVRINDMAGPFFASNM